MKSSDFSTQKQSGQRTNNPRSIARSERLFYEMAFPGTPARKGELKAVKDTLD